MNRIKLNHWIWPLLIMAVAFLFRIYDLNQYPQGLWYDEAIHGLDTLQIYQDHQLPLFFNTNNHPQEPMFSYILAVGFWIFGVSAFTLRLIPALIGICTVVLFYYFVRRWWGDRMALIAGLLLATCKWHVMFSRLCFRTILTPFITIMMVWLLLEGMERIKDKFQWRYFIVSGICLGLGMYTYISFRIMPVLVFLLVAHQLFHTRRQDDYEPRLWKGMGLTFLVGFVIFLPLLIDFIHNPFHFSGRTDEITVFSGGYGEGIRMILSNTYKTLCMMGIPKLGDPEWKHNFSGEPILPLWLFLFWLVGIYRMFQNRKDLRLAAMGLMFGLYLVPGIMSQGAPNSLRTLGAVPALCFMTAYGMDGLWKIDFLNLKSWLKVGLVVVLLLGGGVWTWHQYFVMWGPDTRTAQHFNINEYRLARSIHQSDVKADFYLQDVLASQPTIRFTAYPMTLKSVTNLSEIPAPESLVRDAVVVFLNPRMFNMESNWEDQLLSQYPHAELKTELMESSPSPWVLAYYINVNTLGRNTAQ